MTSTESIHEQQEELSLIKEVFADSWVLDQSYLANGTVIRTGICPCLNIADLIIVKSSGSVWICRDCLYQR